MQHSRTSIIGYGGDALSAPENTEVSYWAALGGGASAIATGVRLSQDNVLVCCNDDNFQNMCDDPRKVNELNWDEIRYFDAGVTFRSTSLDSDNQPTGKYGTDTPWQANLPRKRAIRVQRLSEVLKLFGRRCSILIFLPDEQPAIVEQTLELLSRLGLVNRVQLVGNLDTCNMIKDISTTARYILIANEASSPSAKLYVAENISAEGFYLDWDEACVTTQDGIELEADLKLALDATSIRLLLGSAKMPYAATPRHFDAIKTVNANFSVLAKGVLPTVEAITPASLIISDDFEGNQIDRNIWSAGYSHTNQDTEIYQKDGLHIVIKEGGAYSGAAAVCTLPIRGRFDARTKFHVTNPKQATTFELAAICIDPGYFRIDNSDLTSRNVNLTFDVHGAPPYASSERDEDDGFRCGWNNGFNLTRIDEDWSASSVNMYNKYGRDVGNGAADNPDGQLRLVRNGPVFSCYYTDKYNEAWVCSGAMLVQNLTDDIFLRLAAKHWSKGGVPPANHVQFQSFQIYQF